MSNSEYSAYHGAPIEFYHISYVGQDLYQVSADTDLLGPDSITYEGRAIYRDGAISSTEISKNVLELKVEQDNPMTAPFKKGQPDSVVFLEIKRKQVIDDIDTFILVWKGRITQCNWEGTIAKLSAEPVSSSMKRLGLRTRFQKLCRHSLGDQNCKVDMDTFSATATIVTYAGRTIKVNSLGGLNPAHLVNGFVTTDLGASRMIIGIAGTILKLSYPFNVEEVGIGCIISGGCDHTLGTCTNIYDNRRRYGGFANIPTKNPFNGRIDS
jgi:hypothetical protein